MCSSDKIVENGYLTVIPTGVVAQTNGGVSGFRIPLKPYLWKLKFFFLFKHIFRNSYASTYENYINRLHEISNHMSLSVYRPPDSADTSGVHTNK